MRKTFLPNTAKFLTILFLSVVLISSKAFSAGGTYQWTGTAGDGMWTNPANWLREPGGVIATDWPGDSSFLNNVLIPSAGVTTFPILANASAYIQGITVRVGATLTLNSIGELTTRSTFTDSGSVIVEDNGSYLYLTGASNTNAGTINVNNGGFVEDSSAFINNGTIDIADNLGTTFYFDAALTNTGTIMGSATDFSIYGAAVMSGNVLDTQTIYGKGKINDLYIDINAGVRIAPGDSIFLSDILVVNGTLNTNNVLVLTSDSVHAGIIGSSPGIITGNITEQQYIPGGRRAYRFWGHPFSSAIPLSQIEKNIDLTGTGGSINGFSTTITNNPSVAWYNTAVGNSTMPSDPGWTWFTNTNGVSANAFNPGEGILLFMRGQKGQGLTGCPTCYTPKATYISMYGSPNQGNVNVTLHVGTNSDYNQVSNPYPCPIDINNAIGTADTAHLIAGVAFYVWDAHMATAGAFQAITIDTVTWNQYYISANTSFQVRAASDGAILSFNEGLKAAGIDTGTTRLLRKATPTNPFQYVTLDIYDASSVLWDIFHLKFNSEATDALDDYDATKPSNTDLNFYSLSSDDKMMAIDARPYQDGQIIPLGINTKYSQTFTVKADEFSLPSTGNELYLHDKYLSQYIQLDLGTSYTFDITSDPASQGDNRFELISGTPAGLYNVNNAAGFEAGLIPNPATGQVNVSFKAQKAGDASIVIKNLIGQQFYSEELGVQQSGNVNIFLDEYPAGLYIAEIKCGDEFVTKKFIKQ